MAGKVQQQQIIGPPVGEELLHCQVDLVGWLVQQGAHLEAADLGIAQHAGQRLGVAGGGAQLPQPRVGVVVAGDDQGAARAVHRAVTGFRGGAATRR